MLHLVLMFSQVVFLKKRIKKDKLKKKKKKKKKKNQKNYVFKLF